MVHTCALNLLALRAAGSIAAKSCRALAPICCRAKHTHGGVLPSFCLDGVAGVGLLFVHSGFAMVAVIGRGVGPLGFSLVTRCEDISGLLAGDAGVSRRQDIGA